MRDVNLCYLIKDNKILLGLKKRGFGKDKLNGFGGKIKQGENIRQAAIRELKEEICIQINHKNLKKVAEIDFFFTNAPKDWDQKVHVFLINEWKGSPKESEEMRPVWFNTDKIPFDKMWQDDSHWLPLVISGKKLKAEFTFGQDNEKVIKKKIDLIEGFK